MDLITRTLFSFYLFLEVILISDVSFTVCKIIMLSHEVPRKGLNGGLHYVPISVVFVMCHVSRVMCHVLCGISHQGWALFKKEPPLQDRQSGCRLPKGPHGLEWEQEKNEKHFVTIFYLFGWMGDGFRNNFFPDIDIDIDVAYSCQA